MAFWNKGKYKIKSGNVLDHPAIKSLDIPWWENAVMNRAGMGSSDAGLAVAMSKSIPAFRCIQVISNAVAAMPWEIVDIKADKVIDGSEAMDSQHPLAKAIKQQYIRTGQSFFNLWSQSLLVTGKNFIQPMPSMWDNNPGTGKYRQHVGIEWLNPLSVSIDEYSGSITGYWYNGPNKNIKLNANEVVYNRYLNFTNENEGLSPLAVAINNVRIDIAAKQAVDTFYINHCLPYAVVSPTSDMRQSLREDEMKRLKETLRIRHKGVSNFYRAITLNFPVDIKTFDMPDLEKHARLINDLENEIYVAFGVPPAVAGDTSNTPFKDAPETYEAFYTQALEPMIRGITICMNDMVMEYFDKSHQYQFRFDTSRYDTLRKNEAQDIANAQLLYNSGAITLQDYRKKSGAVLADENDEYQTLEPMVFVPALNAPVPINQLNNLWERLLPQSSMFTPLAETPTADAALAQPKPALLEAPIVDDNDIEISDTITRKSYIDYLYHCDNDLFPDELEIETRIRNEMRQWVKFAKANYGRKNARQFEPRVLPYEYVEYIERGLKAVNDINEISGAIWGILDAPMIKTMQSYSNNLQIAARRLWRGVEGRDSFIKRLERAIDMEFAQAYKTGLTRGGYTDDLTKEHQDVIKQYADEDKSHLAELANYIVENRKAEGGELSVIRSRIGLWIARIPELEELGYLASRGDRRLKWFYNPQREHCEDCQYLNGKVYTATTWVKMQIHPKSHKLKCFGINCGCSWEETEEPVSRGRPGVWKSEHKHEHNHSD